MKSFDISYKLFFFLLLPFVSKTIFCQTDTMYIDPSLALDGSGTQASPWNGSKLSDGSWKANTTYLFKRGTTYSHSNKINIQVAGVTLGAYGDTGKAPIIQQTTNNDNIIGSGSLTVTCLELIIPTGASGQDGYQLSFMGATGYLNVMSCSIHGGGQGIRALSCPLLTINVSYCQIYDMWSDGMFIATAANVEAGNCHIYHVNLSQPNYPADGDCIHIIDAPKVHIYNNILDHSSTDGKFCLILATGSSLVGSALVENNIMKRNRTGSDATIFYSNWSHGSTIVLRCNKFQDALLGLQSRTYDMQIYYNLFTNMDKCVELSAPADFASAIKFWNNTVYNCGQVLYGYGEKVDCKNTIAHTISAKAFDGGTNITLDYNDYYNIKDFGGLDKGTHDLAADPLFTDTAQAIFALKSGSPCIDKGADVLGKAKDINGINVPFGSAPDMGAYEFDPRPEPVNKPLNRWLRAEYLTISPNPNYGRFIIKKNALQFADYVEIAVRNMCGKIVYKTQVPGNAEIYEFNVKNLKSGAYILSVTTGKNEPVDRMFMKY